MENEANVHHALTTYHPCLVLEPQQPYIGVPGLEGHGLSEEDRRRVQRFDPADDHQDQPGFFCARFRKVRSLYDPPPSSEERGGGGTKA